MLHSLIPMLIALIRFAYLLCDCSLIFFSFSELQHFFAWIDNIFCHVITYLCCLISKHSHLFLDG